MTQLKSLIKKSSISLFNNNLIQNSTKTATTTNKIQPQNELKSQFTVLDSNFFGKISSFKNQSNALRSVQLLIQLYVERKTTFYFFVN